MKKIHLAKIRKTRHGFKLSIGYITAQGVKKFISEFAETRQLAQSNLDFRVNSLLRNGYEKAE